MFHPIFDFLNAGSTGIFVSVVLAMESFCRERRNSRKKATVDDYLEWLRREDQKELLSAQQQFMQVLAAHDETSQLLHEYLQILMSRVDGMCSSLTHIDEKVSALPKIEQKIDVIAEALTSGDEEPRVGKGQIAVSARVFEALAAGGKGAGVRVMMRHEGNNPQEGTLALRWVLGERSPEIMLADYVGDTAANRLSLILQNDASVSLRTFDANGTRYIITSRSYSEAEAITPVATWKGREIALWVNGKCCGRESMVSSFHYLGPVLLYGMDIDGVLSADRAQW
ncbi:MAG: hypothetical protein ACOC7M_03170 [Chloroflexota bacterium]